MTKRVQLYSERYNDLRPRTMAASWPDPDDHDPLRREPRRVDGQVRHSVLLALHRRSPTEVTDRHMAAALRLILDHEASQSGQRVTADYEGVGGQSSPMPGKPADRALDALGRLRDAQAWLGELYDPIGRIVIQNWPVARWAGGVGCNESVAKGYLIAALTVLADYYDRMQK